jgi:cytochrome c2
MPSSLRLLGLLVAASLLIAVASVVILKRQDQVQAKVIAEQLTGGSVSSGKASFISMGCGACHAVQFVAQADGQVGPSLDQIATRVELAGHLPNTPENLRLWIQHPQQVSPGNGMPDLGLTDKQAKDISAYLYTLKSSQ